MNHTMNNTMTIPGRLRAELLVALQSQDWERLDDTLTDLADELGGEEQAQDLFRAELLPDASVEMREAFWRQAMTDDQFDGFIENMTMAATARLRASDYELGKDFSFAQREDGLRLLVISDKARAFLAGFYEKPQMASLSIVLRRIDDESPDPSRG